MTKSVSEFTIKYELNDYKLFENENWIVSLRPEQKTPFSMIISIKSNIFQLRDLNSSQILELQETYKFIENISYDNLKANKINFLCLMMVDSIVHFHVFPRFEGVFNYKNIQLMDKYFPKPVDLTDGYSLNTDTIDNIFKQYLDNVNL